MATIEDDLSACTALVVDGNFNARSVLVGQLRALGIGAITQVMRVADARRHLETQRFDFVLCEMHFSNSSGSGQELLDDLRRNHLLPFSTVFLMITGEATYASVAEAAESALDGYLLKPHKATQLEERLLVARARKRSLQEIFDAIDAQQFARAAALCRQRFAERGLFWLYCARVGAELLLRLGEHAQAQALYQEVLDAKPMPWARLGMARAELEAGRTLLACAALEKLLNDDMDYADAYDLMARAQFEFGQFDRALMFYNMAAQLTPYSISRVQSAAMMTCIAGSAQQAIHLLERTVQLGLDSKLFDAQTLVLLAFLHLGADEYKGVQRCADAMARLRAREPESTRLQRLAHCVELAVQMQHPRAAGGVLERLLAIASDAMGSEFSFESASNLLTLLALLAKRSGHFVDATPTVHTLALRFCSSRPFCELLAASVSPHPPYVETVRAAQERMADSAEAAMALHLAGDTEGAIRQMLQHASATLNIRLIDNASQLLRKHGERLADAHALDALAQDLRRRAGAGMRRVSLGNQARQAGALVLRIGPRVRPEDGVALPNAVRDAPK